MSQSPEDRRHEPRIERINLVQVSRFDEKGFPTDLVAGRTLNISEGGLRVELAHSVPLRSTATFSLVLGERILDLSGTVVYLEALDDQMCRVGIRFDEIDDEARELLNEYVTD